MKLILDILAILSLLMMGILSAVTVVPKLYQTVEIGMILCAIVFLASVAGIHWIRWKGRREK